ncbi:putative nuclease HARBI1 [Dermacentor andersoni]|uniref:putative nuclease HARBI1 n=1 Tax=Dermacentor andersoni TaxID=34620 RepID=UPI002155A1DF|nr:putative nuclease HARBI1 [Dermacentor andersoni]
MLQLLIALMYYGAGTFQTVTGDPVHIPQSTVCRAVGKMTLLIAKHLRPMLVRFPQSARLPKVMRDFYEVAEFLGVTGCVDCTHVRIKGPGGNDAEVFRNRKGFFSINVQAVSGPQLQFFDIVAGWPGSVHDSRIFDNSRLRVLYDESRVPGALVVDAGYACQPFLLTPLSDPGPSHTPQGRYQKAHVRTRNIVEMAFGVWKRSFPCLDMGLQHKEGNIVLIITACAALHNLGCLLKEPQPPVHSFPKPLQHDNGKANTALATS